MLKLIPIRSQLWIATHSTGFVRKAVELSRDQDNVAFLDFSGHNFDEPVEMRPTTPNRIFFRKMYDVLQDDLAGLVAPACIVLCEGSENTDAKTYNKIFEESDPDTLFIGRGGSNTVEKGDVIPVLEAVVPTVRVLRLIDRDDMPEPSRYAMVGASMRVLGRREIENYLWDKDVVRKALHNFGTNHDIIENLLKEYPFQNPKVDDLKAGNLLQDFFEKIRRADGISQPGRNHKEFAFSHLAQALRETEAVFQELRDEVFGEDA